MNRTCRPIAPRSRGLRRTAAAGLLVALLSAPLGPAPAPAPPGRLPIALCFAPGTPESYRSAVESKMASSPAIAAYQASASDRWSSTAVDGLNASRGAPTTLTWGIVPDGTSVDGFSNEAAAPSNLRSYLTGLYGSEATWLALFEDVFDRWADLSGVTFVHETADDGAAIGSARGISGVRADIRISGHRIDGNSGTLAYAFFPNSSDIVIDTADNYFRTTSSQSRRFRNTVAHEVGHGLGFNHVCPQNRTKLMEPASGDTFDGPQLDDILAVQRLYGDRLEPNDTPTSATDLGAIGTAPARVDGVSIDGASDRDVYAFEAPPGMLATVVVRPIGKSYLQGAQNSNGSCSSGTAFDALARVDLDVELVAPDRTTVLASVDAAPAGEVETLSKIPLSSGAGIYYVRVDGGGADEVQLYRLDVELTAAAAVPIAVRDALVIDEDTGITIHVLDNDAGVDDEPVRVTVQTPALHGRAIANADGTVSYRPDRDFVGDDHFVYAIRSSTGLTSQAEVTVGVLTSPRAGFAKIDSDEDGFPDDLELALGTIADDGGSRPTDAALAALSPQRTRIALRFGKSGRDKLALRVAAPLSEDFDPNGATLTLYVGGVVRTFTLDARGRASNGSAERLRLRFRRAKDGSVPAQAARVDLVLRRHTLAPDLADEGLTGEGLPRRGYREATVFLLGAAGAAEATLPLYHVIAKNRRRALTGLIRD